MRVNRNRRKPIIFGNCKELLATGIMLYFLVNLVFGEEDNETELCKRKWSELVSDKMRCTNPYSHEDTRIMTPCCVATSVYLEQRYQNYIRSCPIVEGRCTCDYAERELNYIVFENKSKEVSWNKPRSITCPHKFLLRRKVEPNVTSPHNFSVGLHNVKYIFELYGRRNITCDIDVSIRYCVSRNGKRITGQDKCICNSRAPGIQVFEKGDPSSKLHWSQPCPVCSKDAMEVKEHLVPNIRPPAKLAVGKHAITHTFSYTPVSGSLKETKCFANISVKECMKDILILWDNSMSIGLSGFQDKVVPFLSNFIFNPKLGVASDGTHLGFITFSSEERTRMLLPIGKITEAHELISWLHGLDYTRDLSGRWTYTGTAFELAKQTFTEKNPLNHRNDVSDVILLFTDGNPRAESTRKMDEQRQLARHFSAELKNDKGIKIVSLAVTWHSFRIDEELIASFSTEGKVVTAGWGRLFHVLDELVNKTCLKSAPSGALCGGTPYDRTKKVCCSDGKLHMKRAGHKCCGMTYYDTRTKKCCSNETAIFVPDGKTCP